MNTKEFLAIGKRLLLRFPDFSVKGRLMFIQPIDDTLRGFHFEPSAFNEKAFYVNTFFMPLYVPAKHVHLTFGHRIGSKRRWVADEPDIEIQLVAEMQKEIPFLTSQRTANNVARALKPLTKPNEAGYVNPHSYEALAYALVQNGKTNAAEHAIDALLKCANPTVPWENEIATRARSMRDKLAESLENAREQLHVWKAETVRNLGIEEFRTNLARGQPS